MPIKKLRRCFAECPTSQKVKSVLIWAKQNQTTFYLIKKLKLVGFKDDL